MIVDWSIGDNSIIKELAWKLSKKVADGKGINSQEKKKIFEMFFAHVTLARNGSSWLICM